MKRIVCRISTHNGQTKWWLTRPAATPVVAAGASSHLLIGPLLAHLIIGACIIYGHLAGDGLFICAVI